MTNVLLIVGAVLAVAFLLLPAFLPARSRIARSVNINAPVSMVFAHLMDLREYPQWNPFFEGDESVKTVVSGVGAGSSLSWDGKKCGKGTMTVTKVIPDQLIQHTLDFYKRGYGNGVGLNEWKIERAGMGTILIWSYEQDLPYFLRGFGLIMDKSVGKKFEQSLNNLKNRLEATINVQPTEIRPS